MDPSGSSQRRVAFPKRATHACEACRHAKVRCHGSPSQTPCARCKHLGTFCHFPPSRRGRRIQRLDLDRRRSTLSSDGRPSSDSPAPLPSPDLQSFISTCTPAVLDSLRKCLPVDDAVRDDTPSLVVQQGRVNIQSFGTALQAIQAAASDNTLRQVREGPRLPAMDLSPDDAERWARWSSDKLKSIIRQHARFYSSGPHASRRDVSSLFDPLDMGMISKGRVDELFKVFWTYTHPYCTVLDPRLHTIDYVRERSVFLFTVILAIAATVLTSMEDCTEAQIAEAAALMAHVERMNIVVYATGAKSLEIVQAMILWTDNSLQPNSLVDEDRWTRIAAMNRMAVQIGIHLPTTRTSEAESLVSLNDLRVRIWLVMFDTRFYIFAGNYMSDLRHFELDPEELHAVRAFGVPDCDTGLAAMYELHVFQRTMPGRHEAAMKDSNPDLALDLLHNLVDTFIDQWIEAWNLLGPDEPQRWLWWYEASGVRLLLHFWILRKQDPIVHLPKYQTSLLRMAEELLETCLSHHHIPYFAFKSGYTIFAAEIVSKLGGRPELILRIGLRLAGDPDRPPIRTSTRANGYHILAMLAFMTEVADRRHLEGAGVTTDGVESSTLEQSAWPSLDDWPFSLWMAFPEDTQALDPNSYASWAQLFDA